ncbi:MAG: DUF1295 domain-containing protein [Pseudomonadota bacterium]
MHTWVPYLMPLGLTLVGFVLLWPVSIGRRDASIVDAWWAPGFLAQVLFVASLTNSLDGRSFLLIGLIAIWSIRLTWVLVRRRIREGVEDPRYTSLRKAWGDGFWWKSLFIVFVLQGVIQWLIALGPISALLAGSETLGLLAGAGTVIAIVGVCLETKADAELDSFKNSRSGGKLLTSGLRAHLRHPNYVGEIMFWIGVGLIVAEVSPWGAIISPLVISFFLIKVSGAPMLDEHLEASKPEYVEYRRRVPGFFPKLRRRVAA